MQVCGGDSMSTVSREDNLVFSSEDSSSTPEEPELELGLGLALRAPGSLRRGKILTAKDFPSSASACSSSSSSLSRASVTAGTKRTADSVAAVANGASQVVGWPPIRAYRMNSMVSQAKSTAATEDEESQFRKVKNGDENKIVEDTVRGGNTLFVKVNMDGIPIGRKVELSSHGGYEALARTLEHMFNDPSSLVKLRSSGKNVPSRLLDGSSEHVLTYEDKEGDWMLVGDVPWGMFISSVKRLRIMRTSEANGLCTQINNQL